MGGKVKQYATTVLGIAAIWATAGGASPWVVGLLQGSTIVLGGLAARDAQKRANQAQRDALQDRKVMYRSGVSAKGYAYGQVWMSGAIAFHRSPKSSADPFFWIVLALPIKHRIKSIHRIYFGERSLGPLASNGDATAPEFTKVERKTGTLTGFIPAGNVVTAPMFGGDSGFVLGPAQNEKIVCATRQPAYGVVNPEGGPAMGEYDKVDVAATVEPGTTNRIRIPGTVGDEFQLTYRYQTTTIFIRAWTYLGDPDQTANADLITATANEVPDMRWDASCRLRGVPYVILRIRPDTNVFPKELENITVWMDGKDDVLDPRTGLGIHTDNPMLVARDYAIAQCGVIPGDIKVADLNAEANVCDELITQPDPITGVPTATRRYTTNCFLSTESAPKDNLATILSSCDGSVVESGATVDFRCGHYEEPSLALGESDFASDPEIVKSPDMADTFNGIKARFTDTARPFWPLVDGTEYLSQFYLNKDRGRVAVEEIDLTATTSGVSAYRLSKQMLHKHRAGLTLTAVFKLKAEQLAPQQTVWLTHRAIGNDEKVYRVDAMDPVSLTTVRLTLKEDGPLLYQWDFDEAAGIDPAPNSNLPSVRVVPLIQGLGADTSASAMVRGPDGNLIAQCRVFWTPVTDPQVLNGGHIEVRYKRSIDYDWNRTQELPPQALEHRFPIFRNDVLIIEARLANSLVKGEWTQIVEAADDTPVPYIVSNNQLLNPQWDWTGGPGPESFSFVGWTKLRNNGTTTTAEGSFFPSGATTNFTKTGVVVVGPYGTPAVGDLHWIYSDAVAVTEYERIVAFVRCHPEGCTAVMAISWYSGADALLRTDRSAVVQAMGATSIRFESGWATMSIFATPPGGSAYVKITLSMTVTSASTSIIFLHRPYVGKAAIGQVTLPPWRS